MNAHFVRRYGGPLIHCIEELGGRFAAPVTNPAASVVAAGYRQVAEVSIVECARELGALSTPPWFLNTFLRGLRDGYRVYIFEAKKGA
jgi:hypothetical protein